ncbi:beta-1,4-mannooligosaccharide phosphorylase [bacterium BMS3Abin03]|nr:beta-1,4-mannooligosaccharide phosphorylase [bacterium BMS3Abin03]
MKTREIIKYDKNPILSKSNVPFKVNGIFNPGAVKFDDNYLLLCRVEMPNGRSGFVLAKSTNGHEFKVDSKPCLTPEDHKECYEYVEWGIEDPRITRINDVYYLTYTGYSKHEPLVILAETKDFNKFKIHGPITEPSNKDCAIFPEKIEGHYWKVDRPAAGNRNDIWISKSDDLIHWGSYKCILEPKQGTWESDKIGASTPPVKTSEGWLMLYHGVRTFGSSMIYKVGVVLLDKDKPWIIRGKCENPILSPEFDYERVGDVGNVVFTNGWIVEPDGEIKIYYGGADTNICLAETSLNYLLEMCR